MAPSFYDCTRPTTVSIDAISTLCYNQIRWNQANAWRLLVQLALFTDNIR